MKITKPTIAICYDFDKTLSKKDMQEYGFVPDLGMKPTAFWAKAKEYAETNNADPILAYMKLMIDEAQRRSGTDAITKNAFNAHGKKVEFYKGVEGWFKRVNEFAKAHKIIVEHYIVSSGLKEMIEGTTIFKEFEKVYACSFIYGQNELPIWPAVAVNYTTKTQFLFRINKGLPDNDNVSINEFQPEDERRIPFRRMIYIGDGLTDVPCMKLVKDKGGYSIAVYKPNSTNARAKAEKLRDDDGRVNFAVVANYSEKSLLENLVFRILEEMCACCQVDMLKPSRNGFARPTRPTKATKPPTPTSNSANSPSRPSGPTQTPEEGFQS